MPNIYEPEYDVDRDEPPYVWRRARLGRAAGSERLGSSLFRVPPGGTTFPLHAHLHNEELLVVVEGTPTLRTLDGERVLARGEVVAFLAGRAGAHELRNESDADIVVLLVSTMLAPEINLFPDTGELWIRDYIPGTDAPPNAVDIHAPLPDAG
ncbi:cupin domain-containing protein [Baekduia sp. Peel2402]|uniref:cupin domain-containing protein n=1 Tax=Baekduia sp. Peel2402 TaxID=3458296 RepID=UPI00403EF5D1